MAEISSTLGLVVKSPRRLPTSIARGLAGPWLASRPLRLLRTRPLKIRGQAINIVARCILQASGGPLIIDPVSGESRRQVGELDLEGYRLLAEFRYLIRRFLEFSEAAARRAGLTPRQHQALLAIKGFASDRGPTVGDLAERLCIRHHSAVELIDRLVEAGFCLRGHDSEDRRRVILRLTETAEAYLAALSSVHLEELRSLRPALLQILEQLGGLAQLDGAGT